MARGTVEARSPKDAAKQFAKRNPDSKWDKNEFYILKINEDGSTTDAGHIPWTFPDF
jgi:hypothetical protein